MQEYELIERTKSQLLIIRETINTIYFTFGAQQMLSSVLYNDWNNEGSFTIYTRTYDAINQLRKLKKAAYYHEYKNIITMIDSELEQILWGSM